MRPEEVESLADQEKQETDRNMEEMWRVLAAHSDRHVPRRRAGGPGARTSGASACFRGGGSSRRGAQHRRGAGHRMA